MRRLGAILLVVGLALVGAIPAWADHEDCEWEGDCGGQSYDQWNNDQNNHNRRNRGAFSPGPFDRSPVEMHDVCISLDCSGREKRNEGEQPPEEMR